MKIGSWHYRELYRALMMGLFLFSRFQRPIINQRERARETPGVSCRSRSLCLVVSTVRHQSDAISNYTAALPKSCLEKYNLQVFRGILIAKFNLGANKIYN
jgi:hypothetical protein